MSLYAGLLKDDEKASAAEAAKWRVKNDKDMLAQEAKRKRLVAEAKQADQQGSAQQPAAKSLFVPAALRRQANTSANTFKPRTAAVKAAASSTVSVTSTPLSEATAHVGSHVAAPPPAHDEISLREPFVESAAANAEIQVPYDPFRPNDYRDVKVRKAHETAAEEEAAEEARKRRATHRVAIAPPASLQAGTSFAAVPPPAPATSAADKVKVNLAATGDEAYNARMQLG